MAKKETRGRRKARKEKITARQRRRLRRTLADVDVLGAIGALDRLPVLDAYLDSRGEPVEKVLIGGEEVIIHYRDVLESDLTTVDGIRCTTALRTVIDLAPEVDTDQLDRMVADALRRELFTVDEAITRIDQPDMADDPGAAMLRDALARLA